MRCTRTTLAGNPCRNLSRRGDCGQHVPGIAPRLANAAGTPLFTDTDPMNSYWMDDEDAPVRLAAYPGATDMTHWAEEQADRGTGPILIGQVGSGAPMRPTRIDPIDAAEMVADGRVGFAIAGGRIARVEPDNPKVAVNGPWMRVKESDLTVWVIKQATEEHQDGR